jgi:hypothetical protein
MRHALLLTVVIAVALAARGAADSKGQAPRTLPPRFVVVQSVTDREVTIGELFAQPRIVSVAGTPSVERSSDRVQWRWELLAFSLERIEVYDVRGKRIPAEAARKRLSTGQVVLLSADARLVDPLYLRAVREDTLILVSKGDRSK